MPPKATPDETIKADVRILIELIRSAAEFKADTTQMAAVCGLTAAKNVPRKINSIVSPFGYEFRGGKIMSKDCSDNDKDDKSTDENGKVPKTPKTPKLPTTPKTKSAKKRKIEDENATAKNDSIQVNDAKIEENMRKETVDNGEDAVNNDEEA